MAHVITLSQIMHKGFVDLWHPEVILLGTMLAVAYLLIVGPWRHLFAESRPVRPRQIVLFLIGLSLLYLGIGSPIDYISDHYLFSVHMVEHMLITLGGPPLLLLGLPDWLIRPLLRPRPIKWAFRLLTHPVIALMLFNAVLAAYHDPMLYEAGLRNEAVHFMEHGVLFFTAMIMWWPVLSPLPEMPRLRLPGQMVYLFVDGVMMLPVFALLTFSGAPIIPTYVHAPRLWGISPLEDQQIGGIIMKLFALFAYGIPFFLAFGNWARAEMAKDREVVFTVYPSGRQQVRLPGSPQEPRRHQGGGERNH